MTIPDYLASGEPARLIPVAADSNKEVRAASIILSVLMSVPPFARVMLGSLGQRVGSRAKIDCFTEVVFKNPSSEFAKARPDGLIILDGGRGRLWRGLVEAKIGRAELETEQVSRYLGLAKNQKIDAVLTVSNQFVSLPNHSPVSVPKNALRGVNLFHWSWMNILTQGMLILNDHEFDKPEQRYLLAEMVRYFSHPSVGVSSFDRMNREWRDLNSQIQSGAKLSRTSPIVENSVGAWHQEVRDLCLLLSRKVERPVQIKLNRSHKDDPMQRLRDDSAQLVDEHQLVSSLDVPDAAAPIDVVVDLQRRSVSVSMTLTAPRDKARARSRITWIRKQLEKTKPDDIYIRASWPGRAPTTQAKLTEVREDNSVLESDNKSLIPSKFEVLLIRDLAGKFAGTKTFIENIEEAVPYFYEQVGQHLRAYVASPPRVREDDRGDEAEEELDDVAEAASARASDATDETQARTSQNPTK